MHILLHTELMKLIRLQVISFHFTLSRYIQDRVRSDAVVRTVRTKDQVKCSGQGIDSDSGENLVRLLLYDYFIKYQSAELQHNFTFELDAL